MSCCNCFSKPTVGGDDKHSEDFVDAQSTADSDFRSAAAGGQSKDFAAAKTALDKQGEQGSVVISEWAARAAETAQVSPLNKKADEEEAEEFADAEGFEEASDLAESSEPPVADVVTTEPLETEALPDKQDVPASDSLTTISEHSTSAQASASASTSDGEPLPALSLKSGEKLAHATPRGRKPSAAAALARILTGRADGGPLACCVSTPAVLDDNDVTTEATSRSASVEEPVDVPKAPVVLPPVEGVHVGLLQKIEEGEEGDELADYPQGSKRSKGKPEAPLDGATSAAVPVAVSATPEATASAGTTETEARLSPAAADSATGAKADPTVSEPASSTGTSPEKSQRGLGLTERVMTRCLTPPCTTPAAADEEPEAQEEVPPTGAAGTAAAAVTASAAAATAAAAAAATADATESTASSVAAGSGKSSPQKAAGSPLLGGAGAEEDRAGGKKARFLSFLSMRSRRQEAEGEAASEDRFKEDLAPASFPASPLVLSGRTISLEKQNSFGPLSASSLNRAHSFGATSLASLPAPRHQAGASLPCVADLLGLADWEALEDPLAALEAGREQGGAGAPAAAAGSGPGSAAAAAAAAAAPDAHAVPGEQADVSGIAEGAANEEAEAPAMQHYWEPLPPSEFLLRGEEFFRSGKKQPAYFDSPYTVTLVDLLQAPSRLMHVTRLVHLPAPEPPVDPAEGSADEGEGSPLVPQIPAEAVTTERRSGAMAMLSLAEPSVGAVGDANGNTSTGAGPPAEAGAADNALGPPQPTTDPAIAAMIAKSASTSVVSAPATSADRVFNRSMSASQAGAGGSQGSFKRRLSSAKSMAEPETDPLIHAALLLSTADGFVPAPEEVRQAEPVTDPAIEAAIVLSTAERVAPRAPEAEAVVTAEKEPETDPFIAAFIRQASLTKPPPGVEEELDTDAPAGEAQAGEALPAKEKAEADMAASDSPAAAQASRGLAEVQPVTDPAIAAALGLAGTQQGEVAGSTAAGPPEAAAAEEAGAPEAATAPEAAAAAAAPEAAAPEAAAAVEPEPEAVAAVAAPEAAAAAAAAAAVEPESEGVAVAVAAEPEAAAAGLAGAAETLTVEATTTTTAAESEGATFSESEPHAGPPTDEAASEPSADLPGEGSVRSTRSEDTEGSVGSAERGPTLLMQKRKDLSVSVKKGGGGLTRRRSAAMAAVDAVGVGDVVSEVVSGFLEGSGDDGEGGVTAALGLGVLPEGGDSGEEKEGEDERKREAGKASAGTAGGTAAGEAEPPAAEAEVKAAEVAEAANHPAATEAKALAATEAEAPAVAAVEEASSVEEGPPTPDLAAVVPSSLASHAAEALAALPPAAQEEAAEERREGKAAEVQGAAASVEGGAGAPATAEAAGSSSTPGAEADPAASQTEEPEQSESAALEGKAEKDEAPATESITEDGAAGAAPAAPGAAATAPPAAAAAAVGPATVAATDVLAATSTAPTAAAAATPTAAAAAGSTTAPPSASPRAAADSTSPGFSTVGLPSWLILNLQLPAPSILVANPPASEGGRPARPSSTVSLVVYGQISKEFWRTAPPQMAELLKGLRGADGLVRDFTSRRPGLGNSAPQALPFRERLKLVLRMGPAEEGAPQPAAEGKGLEGGAEGGTKGEVAADEAVELMLHPHQMMFRGSTADGQSYLELDVDGSRLHAKSRDVIESHVETMRSSVADLALVCQANSEDEGQEPVLMSLRLCKLDITKASTL